MPKLARIKQGTQALQAKLAASKASDEERQANFVERASQGADRVGDRLEGAIARLMSDTSQKANKGVFRELAAVINLVHASHKSTFDSLLHLATMQRESQAEVKDILFDLKTSRPLPKGDDHLVERLEQIATSLGNLPPPPSMPKLDVDLSPLTDLSNQILSSVNQPLAAKRQHTFEIERDPFTDLILKVHVKEI
jgi:hypothetical protein